MSYRIRCDDEVIGTSNLEDRDAGMGTARGAFKPAPGYARVRDIFRLFASALRDTGPADESLVNQYYRARDQLNLWVETTAGRRIDTDVVHIVDLAEEVDEDAYEVEVHLSASGFFEPGSPGA